MLALPDGAPAQRGRYLCVLSSRSLPRDYMSYSASGSEYVR